MFTRYLLGGLIVLITGCTPHATYTLQYETGADEFIEGCLAGVALMQMEYYEITASVEYLTEEQRNRICTEALQNKKSLKRNIIKNRI